MPDPTPKPRCYNTLSRASDTVDGNGKCTHGPDFRLETDVSVFADGLPSCQCFSIAGITSRKQETGWKEEGLVLQPTL